MMNRLVITACLLLICVVPLTAAAGDSGVGIKASTLGAGVEYENQFHDNFGMRLGLNYFKYDSTISVDDIEYDSSVNLQSASAILDWYPSAGSFRLTGGIMLNGNDADIEATPNTPVTIGDNVYTPEMVGTLSSSATFNALAPYAGVGWSSGTGKSGGLSFAFDIGILFQGSPSIEDYHATGSVAGDPAFQDDVDKEVAKLEDDLDSYRFYPVAALTLTYRF